jgi:DNA-directed RNA polymerase subunit RPC12/RpoP
MYLIVVSRCIECGDELETSYVKTYGLLCPICLHELALTEKEVM